MFTVKIWCSFKKDKVFELHIKLRFCDSILVDMQFLSCSLKFLVKITFYEAFVEYLKDSITNSHNF